MKILKSLFGSSKSLFLIFLESLYNVIKIVLIIFFWTLFYLTRLLTFPFRMCFSPKDMDTMSGIDFENFIVKWLRLEGYRSIKTTDMSGDYGVDILAVKDGVKIGIQCKRYSKSVGISAVQEVTAGLSYYECEKGIVITNSNFTKNAIDLAASNGVELIDENTLKSSRSAESLLKNNFSIYVGMFIMLILSIASIILDFFVFKYALAFMPLSLLFSLICIISLVNGYLIINDRKKRDEDIIEVIREK